jgi:uncharacterized protein
MVEKKFKISGMTCPSCEKTITRVLRNIPGVKSVRVSYKQTEATVQYDESVIEFKNIEKAIEKEGYLVSKGSDRLDLLLIGAVLFTAYVLIKNSIGFNFIPEVEQGMGFGILFVVGLLTSFHCVAMCGGINLSQTLSYENNEIVVKKTFMPSFLYNSGRVVSYTIIGAMVGALGSVISFSDTVTKSISIFAGFFMIYIGLKMLHIVPALPSFQFSKKVKTRRVKNKKSPFVVGLLNGFMPCGPLQSMQIYALGTGSLLEGGLSMFFFSLGTVPLMFSFGSIGSYISGKFKHQLTRLSAILVIVLGLIMANRGLGFSFSSEEGEKAVIKDGVQYVETTFDSREYQPIIVQKGIPVEWTIIISEEDLNGCNYRMMIQEYTITKELQAGKNTIYFTPDEVGSFTYTCWMRMIRSQIHVVDEL